MRDSIFSRTARLFLLLAIFSIQTLATGITRYVKVGGAGTTD